MTESDPLNLKKMVKLKNKNKNKMTPQHTESYTEAVNNSDNTDGTAERNESVAIIRMETVILFTIMNKI